MNYLDAEREALRRLIGSRKKSDLAQAFGVPGGASMVSQHLSGHRPIALEAGIAYARGFGVQLDEISPRLADMVRAAADLAPGVGRAPPSLEQALETLGVELARDMPDDVREDAGELLRKLAHRRGAQRHQDELVLLLRNPGKRRAAA